MKDTNGLTIQVGDRLTSVQPSGGILPPAKPTTGVVQMGMYGKDIESEFLRYERAKGTYSYIRLEGKINTIELQGEKVKVFPEGESVVVDCPHCDHWEEQPIDQQRWHLQTIELIELGTVETEEEIQKSRMKCGGCEREFIAEWDYDNTFPEED